MRINELLRVKWLPRDKAGGFFPLKLQSEVDNIYKGAVKFRISLAGKARTRRDMIKVYIKKNPKVYF